MSILHDIRISARRLWSAPGFSVATIGMLALGIGFSVAMYCTLNGVMLRSLPFPHSEHLVVIDTNNAAQGIAGAQFTVAEAEQLVQGTSGFSSLAYYTWAGVTLFDGERAREITSHMIGAGYFAALGVEPVLGRLFSDEDIRDDRRLAVLSYAEWQRLGGGVDLIGRQLELVDEDPLEVVGVLPAHLDLIANDTGVWRPLSPRQLPQSGPLRDSRRMLLMFGRVADDSSLTQANAALTATFGALHGRLSADESGWTTSARPLLDSLVGDVRSALWGAFALAVLVLLIAAANVAILFDERQVSRRHELAVMQAIGANQSRLRRAMLIEIALIAGTAIGLGMLVALVTIGQLRELARDSVPRVDGIVMDWPMFGVAVLFGLAAPLVASLAGTLRVRSQPIEAIRAGGKGMVGQSRQRRLLPAIAMALSTVSLITALTLVGALWRLQHVDPGYTSTHVQAMQFFRGGREAFVPFTRQLLDRLAALPGVRDVALTSAAPLSGIGSASVDIRVVGRADEEAVQAGLRRVSAGYRQVLEIPLLRGRDFNDGDRRDSASVVLINQAVARNVLGDADPIGRRISLPLGRDERVECEIIGILADTRNDGLRAPPAPEILVPFAQHPINAMTFLVRSDRPLIGIDAQMAAQLQALDPRQSITRQFALSDAIVDELKPVSFFAQTIGAFAGVALLLAVLGVYAVASLQQRGRVAEFGLRLAIGATPRSLAWNVLRDSVRTSAIGVAAGLFVILLILRIVDMSAIGIAGVTQPIGLGAGVLAMALAALFAALLPALRAARVAPMEALRNE